MTGSFGIGPMEKIVEALHKDVQLLVVCAKNDKLAMKLSQRNFPGVKVFGFVDNADELMAVSDLIITKPGGLSTSEILVMELAPIFICAIPGQEMGNVRALASSGIGIELGNVDRIKKAVLEYKEHPEKLFTIKERIRGVRKPDAAEEICNVVCQGSGGLSSQRPV
jgi:processive 1,2-diacylglycerol beta-glucosyltransferase